MALGWFSIQPSLELQRAEEELEKLHLAINAQDAEITQLRNQLESVHHQKQCATEEAELTLLQLYQVQEELEHYYLQARGADQLATAQQDQLLRAQVLMSRLLPEAAALAPAKRVSLEVLPPSPPESPVQTEALLSSYFTSLRRASALLQRAIQS